MTSSFDLTSLNFPSNNPSWPGGNLGPNGEDAIIKSMKVIFNTISGRLYNSTVWWRAYAYNEYIDPEDPTNIFSGYALSWKI